MITTFQVSESELDIKFLNSLKKMFKQKNLLLTIETVEVDDTTYLNSTSTNRKRLQNAIKNIENGENLIEIDLNKLKSIANA
jgi:predicted regulator of amino acid metabolism with ACT domain